MKSKERRRIILGIDPGMASTGYGVIETYKIPHFVEAGCIYTRGENTGKRLHELYLKIEKLLQRFKPSEVALEQIFFNKNTRTALSVGQARGVIILACSEAQIPLFDYTPLEVKQTICGYGRAKKQQIQEMVRKTLSLSFLPSPSHAADAIALALCHFYSSKLQNL